MVIFKQAVLLALDHHYTVPSQLPSGILQYNFPLQRRDRGGV